MRNIPLIQLIATYIVSFFDISGISYTYLSNFLGYSILTSIYILSKKDISYIEKLCARSLLLISSFNLVSTELNYEKYDKLFQTIVLISIIISSYAYRKRTF